MSDQRAALQLIGLTHALSEDCHTQAIEQQQQHQQKHIS